MKAFAALLDRLAYEPGRNAKLTLLEQYFRATPDPARGYALAAMTGGLVFSAAKPALVRGLIAERCDPVLFALSYDFVGDLSETVALLWPPAAPAPAPALDEVVLGLQSIGKLGLARQIALWLDALDEAGRWALLKLITGSLRIGISARLAKTALARLGNVEPDAIEDIWHGLRPPYTELFAWLEGNAPKPKNVDPAPFRPPMLAQALDGTELGDMDPAAFAAEWKWDGIRIQAAVARDGDTRVVRLYSRSGDEISAAFPDLAEALAATEGDYALDGELLVLRDGEIAPFGELQQRLNRKGVTAKLLQDYPAHLRAYDLLAQDGEDLRALPYDGRRVRLEALVKALNHPRVSLSQQVPFAAWATLAAARLDPALAGEAAEAVEGLMLKRRDSPYVPGRPKGLWFKWKRDPLNADCVMMYAQRGHGKRSSFYSDFTFGVWSGAELVPVGKAYFGFTDEELGQLDKFVRANTVNRFGPVREVARQLVLEIAFEGLNRSTRHKSGLAMRFPRIARIRWDKKPEEADRIETLEAMLG